VKLCKEVEFEKDISWMGTTGFVDAINKLWETACHIGYSHGQEDADSDSNSNLGAPVVDIEKELEQERVWGFDVGWKLCSELQQSRAMQASLVVPSPSSPRSLSVASTQTDVAAVVIAAPVDASAAPVPLDWAEDAASLPTLPLQAESPPSSTRDFSALITSSPQPFASLQRRRRRSPRPATSSLQNPTPQRHSIRRPPKKSGVYHAVPRRTPLPYLQPPPSVFPAPTSFPPSDRPAAQFPLDWDQDPRLRDLGQALAALGWVRL